MTQFSIIPTDRSRSAAVIDASDAGAVLPIVQRLDCKAADVLREGEYCFSARLDDNGLWCIYQRQPAIGVGVVALARKRSSPRASRRRRNA